MSEPPASKCVRVRVIGRVQGVGFRAWVRRTATNLGLSGWVRNLQDGSVEAMLSGPAAVVDDMVGRCRYGPRSSEVVSIETWPATGSFEGFDIRPTQ